MRLRKADEKCGRDVKEKSYKQGRLGKVQAPQGGGGKRTD